ncbi:hypothetical protein NKH77_23505 [Streptomyces sp. M19]
MGNRPTDWHILDLDGDPVPGDPERVRTLAWKLHSFADDVGDALRLINGMAGDDALLKWAGSRRTPSRTSSTTSPRTSRSCVVLMSWPGTR